MDNNKDNNQCPQHPGQPVTARCVRFNRRFCELDFEDDAEHPAECLSEGTYCEYRQQCLVWEKTRERKRKERAQEAARQNDGPGN